MNIIEKLSREIERVVIIHERYYRHAVEDRSFVTAIILMDAAIEAGHQAMGHNDLEIARAIETLGEFDDSLQGHDASASCMSPLGRGPRVPQGT